MLEDFEEAWWRGVYLFPFTPQIPVRPGRKQRAKWFTRDTLVWPWYDRLAGGQLRETKFPMSARSHSLNVPMLDLRTFNG
jgi:hypothetical protein